MTRARVMTRFGHDPIQNLGHDRDPVMTHNTTMSILYVFYMYMSDP